MYMNYLRKVETDDVNNSVLQFPNRFLVDIFNWLRQAFQHISKKRNAFSSYFLFKDPVLQYFSKKRYVVNCL